MANLNSRKKYHFIYKTTCLITSKYYIGMHSTNKLDDGYKGSGKRLWRSINKYGLENHVTEILEFVNDRDSLVAREKEIVNEELITDPMCMNLKIGGYGGFTREQQQENARRSNLKQKELSKTNTIWYQNKCKSISDGNKKAYVEGRREKKIFYDWTGKHHSKDTKEKLKGHERQCGKKNSQYGTIWITDGVKNTKINKDDVIPEGWSKGRKIKN